MPPTKCLLVLPGPDYTQMTNINRYVTERQYTEVYTLQTIVGKLSADTMKIVVIGHGDTGLIVGSTIAGLAAAITLSGAMDDSKVALKLGIDTCFAGDGGNNSVLNRLKAMLPKSRPVQLSGGEGPTITGIHGGHRYYLTPDPNRIAPLGQAQGILERRHGITLSTTYPGIDKSTTSLKFKTEARKAYLATKAFFEDFKKAADRSGLADKATHKIKV